MAFMTDLRANLSKWVFEFLGKYVAKLGAAAVAVAMVAGTAAFVGLDELMLWVVESLPVGVVGEAAQWIEYFEMANLWFPAKETLTALYALFVFKATFITVKLIIKMIPTVG